MVFDTFPLVVVPFWQERLSVDSSFLLALFVCYNAASILLTYSHAPVNVEGEMACDTFLLIPHASKLSPFGSLVAWLSSPQ